MNKIGIFGLSGMALEAADISRKIGSQPILVARDKSEKSRYCGDEIVITEEEALALDDIKFVIGIGDTKIRKAIAEKYSSTLQFTNLIHPQVSFGSGELQKIESQIGIIVAAGVRVTNNVHIGNFVILNLNATVSHDTYIGSYTTIAPQACVLGNVSVREGAWIGAGAIINQGRADRPMQIGGYVTIGSGAVVTKDCLNQGIYVGVPARKI
ncbi:acetyltransferase [Alphaproteobacteria bacterium]|nr:acetyltransferase [Alphaproteobacteria bacterium]